MKLRLLCLLLVFAFVLSGCARELPPEEAKKMAVEYLDLFKEAAEVVIEKDLKFSISNYTIKDAAGLPEEELFQECLDLGIYYICYSNGKNQNGDRIYNGKPYYIDFQIRKEGRSQGILYIPPESDYETPEEIIEYNGYEKEDIIEILELDENWYYYLTKVS